MIENLPFKSIQDLMNTNILKKVIGFEIEATTRCNAGCPGCRRYDYDELDKLN